MGDLLHNLFGGLGAANAAQGTALGQAVGHGVAAKQAKTYSHNKRVFHGNIEVLQVANGYVVSIGTREGYEYETHIASSITEVNEIIAAQIVAFRLEDKA